MIEGEDLKEQYIVSSLVRGFKILSAFTVRRPFLKVTEIAEMTGLDQSTAFRYVYTLEHLGYLVRDDETKRYHQSVRMLTISLPAREGIAVREVALPTMFELSRKINETVKLAVLDGVEIVMIALAEVLDKLVYRTPIGHRLPVYCTSLGKVLLAYQPVEAWDQLISKIDFEPRTEKTITDHKQFRDVLLKVRDQGYWVQDGEMVIGLGSISAPIFEHDGAIAAAINISGLSMEILSNERVSVYIDELLKCAGRITSKLNYSP